MAVNSKNLGQVAGVAIQTTPPSNITLIWYDSTPSQMCHKIYDTAKKQWVIIDQKIISLITYSEMENIARQSGLPLGKFYQITDRSNALALAITSTKVQYCDSLGNILIDDLGRLTILAVRSAIQATNLYFYLKNWKMTLTMIISSARQNGGMYGNCSSSN